MTTVRSTHTDTLADQKTAAIVRPPDGAKIARPNQAKPTELLNRGELGMPHQEPISDFVTKASDEVRRHSRIVESSFFLGCVIFLAAVGGAAWYTEGQIFKDVVVFLQSFEPEGKQSRDKAANCRDPRNKNTPYCGGSSSSSGPMSFSSVAGVGKGKPMPFTLHGK